LKTSGKHEHESAHHEHKEHETKHEAKHSDMAEHTEHKADDKKVPGSSYQLISSIIIVVLLALIIFLLVRKPAIGPSGPGTGTGTTPADNKDKVKVEFYVMSQCPYGTQVENAIAPVLESLGNAVDFHLDFIGQETSPGVFQSLHGEKEVKGDIVQLCTQKYYPDNYQFVKFVLCQNKDAANVDTNWATCAQENNMDSAKLKACLEGAEGKTLLSESFKRAQERKAQGSPTMYFADSLYQGQRDSLSFQRAICKTAKSSVCADLPKCASDADCTEQPTKDGYCTNPGQKNATCEYKDPVKVGIIVLNDVKCGASCGTISTNIVQVSKQLFLGATPRQVDVSSAEGKELVQKYGITVVPAFFFDKNVEQTKSWIARADLRVAFELKGDQYKLLDEASGATYFVSEEARKAYYDAIGVVTGDNKPQIDFFVMSYCPYGNQAEEGIAPVYNLIKDKALFKPHYVIYENYGGGGSDYCLDSGKYCSMHGIQELNQDVREMCVLKYNGIGSWFDFALAMNKGCTAANADTCWEAVATTLKLDVAKIKTCQQSEAIALLSADKALGDKLGVSGSPTIFVDGDAYNGGRTPEEYKTALCSRFDTKPSECSTKLEGGATATTTAAATAGCGV
jgi:predicted DsbA family dithiol-disulfide isomerase